MNADQWFEEDGRLLDANRLEVRPAEILEMKKALEDLFQDVSEIVERVGGTASDWWDETVTAGHGHYRQAAAVLGQDVTAEEECRHEIARDGNVDGWACVGCGRKFAEDLDNAPGDCEADPDDVTECPGCYRVIAVCNANPCEKRIGELEEDAEGGRCSVCAEPFTVLSGGAVGCPVHGIREAEPFYQGEPTEAEKDAALDAVRLGPCCACGQEIGPVAWTPTGGDPHCFACAGAAHGLSVTLEHCQGTLHWLRDDRDAPAWILAAPGQALIAEVDAALTTAKGDA